MSQMIQLPDIKAKTIVMDVPWPIQPMILKKYSLSVPYKTMTIEEISDLPIHEISDENCILFFWTTHTFLPESFKIIENYGFKYYCMGTWDKVSGLTHQGFFRVTEFVIVAYKGKLTKCIKQTGKAFSLLFRQPEGRHSEKPQKFDDMVIRSTFEPRIDLFARKRKFGYVCSFGDDKELQSQAQNGTLESFCNC